MLIVYFRNKKGEESPEGCIELYLYWFKGRDQYWSMREPL